MKQFAIATLCAVCLTGSALTTHAQDDSSDSLTPKDWLLLAPDDKTRFELLQQYFRGYDRSMWEIGDRYLVIYDALKLENYDLALYHWRKIKATIENGNIKRPDRKANSEAFFLDWLFEEVQQDFDNRDPETAWEGFEAARFACLGCHDAEGVSYINNQPMFNDTEVQ